MFEFLKAKLKKVFSSAQETEETLRNQQVSRALKTGKFSSEAETAEFKTLESEKTGQKEIKEEKSEKPEIKEEKKGFFSAIKEKFTSTTLDEGNFEEVFQNLETALLGNNVAFSVVSKIKSSVKTEVVGKPVKRSEIEGVIKEALKKALQKILIEPFDLVERISKKEDKPFVIVFFGINGAGKTTAIAKFVHMLKKHKLKCVISASDTFRAASIEQLEKHALKLDVPVIKHKYGADPAAVAYDAISHAKASKKDVVLIDTAGRMNNKADLMREMEKIVRIAKPDLKIFVGESITGNDATEQASSFNSSVGIDAIVLTKADVDERGGAMLSVGEVTGKPVIYLGTGQDYENLEPFNKEKIISSILG